MKLVDYFLNLDYYLFYNPEKVKLPSNNVLEKLYIILIYQRLFLTQKT